MWLIAIALFDLTAASPAAGPRVVGQLAGARRAVVRGAGFEAGERVELLIDDAEPHASIACRAERSVTATADARGRFTVRVSPARGCAFSCAWAYVAWADRACGLDCRQQFTSPPFAFACGK